MPNLFKCHGTIMYYYVMYEKIFYAADICISEDLISTMMWDSHRMA